MYFITQGGVCQQFLRFFSVAKGKIENISMPTGGRAGRSESFGKERILNRMCRIPQFMRGQMPPVPQSIAARTGIQPGTNCPGRFGTQ